MSSRIIDSINSDKNKVIEGTDSLLTLFEVINQPLFPRNIMTGGYTGFFTVYDETQLYQAFERAHFKDCRISAYPCLTSTYKQYIPNIVLLDLDFDSRIAVDKEKGGIETADRVLRIRVNRLLKRLQLGYNINNFMVMHTGNGRHIIIPFNFDKPFEDVFDFAAYHKYLLERANYYNKKDAHLIGDEFLLFAKKYLSNNLADQGNFPSFQSTFLRVPGSLNTKAKFANIETVKIEHNLDYEGSISGFEKLYETDIFHDFQHELAIISGNFQLEMMKRKKYAMRYKQANSTNLQGTKIKWIEMLWNTPLPDLRKRVIWLILSRYAINVKKMSFQEACIWIKDWVTRCSKLQPTGDMDRRIANDVDTAEGLGYKPPAFQTLKSYSWKLDDGTDLCKIISDRMR
jgi:hypothetical protein